MSTCERNYTELIDDTFITLQRNDLHNLMFAQKHDWLCPCLWPASTSTNVPASLKDKDFVWKYIRDIIKGLCAGFANLLDC